MEWFICDLANRDPAQDIALVINGDFIDFLAESDPRHFDPYGAIAKLERIALTDPTFKPIFAALRRFLERANRHLIINLGNHDLELALPWVRRRLVELLTGTTAKDGQLPHRLQLVMDGTGVACTVGGKSVLCLHGNEVDRWNPADFEKIREIGRDVELGRPIEPWIPNAGTQMVIDVMNKVKRRFPFVDLLKPEKEGVVPVLVACDPTQLASLDRLSNALGVAANRLTATLRKPRGMLGEEVMGRPIQSASAAASGAFARTDPAAAADDMVMAVEDALRRNVDPLVMVESNQASQLGTAGGLWKWVNNQSTEEVLREELDKLDTDQSFDPLDYDDTAKALDKEVSPAIDFLLAGHTHLERALPRRYGSGVYFNSGTWARLMRITPERRRDAVAFAKLYGVLQRGNMETLDAQVDVVMKLNTVVAIRAQPQGGATGELVHVVPVPQSENFKMDPVPGTAFTRGG